MALSRYERVPDKEADDASTNTNPMGDNIPSSPPPSFSSRGPSIDGPSNSDRATQPLLQNRNKPLDDTFADSDSDDIDDDQTENTRQRAITRPAGPRSGNNISPTSLYSSASLSPFPSLSDFTTTASTTIAPMAPSTEYSNRTERTHTLLPTVPPRDGPRQAPQRANDGVFSNLVADRSAPDEDEKPPTYDQAAADAAPPYWETTILTPGMLSGEIYIQNMPIGSVFSFIWNAVISLSFQVVGFLLTYLLHTSHAARCGSKVGLGITLIQYGFAAKSSSSIFSDPSSSDQQQGDNNMPANPNDHNFDPASLDKLIGQPPASESSATEATYFLGVQLGDWFAYALMIVGWFVVVQNAVEFMKAKRHEQLALQNADPAVAADPGRVV